MEQSKGKILKASAVLKCATLDGLISWKIENFVATLEVSKELVSPVFKFIFPEANKTFFFSVKIKLTPGGIEFALTNRTRQEAKMSAKLWAGLYNSTFTDLIAGFQEIVWAPKIPLRSFESKYASRESILDITVLFSIAENFQSTTVRPDCIDFCPAVDQPLKSLLTDDSLADFVIECGGKKFPCHKAILANRSDVFAGLFSSGTWLENKSNKFPIKDHSPEVVKQTLEFIYTNQIPAGTTASLDLLIIADQFNLKDLIRLCESELSKTMTCENAIKILSMAEKIADAKRLKDFAAEFIYKNMLSIVSPKEWKQIAESTNLLEVIKNIKLKN